MTTAQRRVLVALSGTAPHAAIGAGRVIAQVLRAPLHGVLVWPTQITPCQVSHLLKITPELLEGMVLDVDVGDFVERVNAMTRAQPIAFVVLAAEGEGRDACGLGELVGRTLAETEADLVILRPGVALGKMQRILVPLDGTPSTAAALAPAGELAERSGAALDVVLIEDAEAEPSDELGAMSSPRYVDQPQHEWPAFSEEFMLRFVGSIARCSPDVPKRFFVGTGRTAAEILRFTRSLDPDLIALVWHGRSSEEHGAIFRDVVRGTSRPLLVLRR